MTVPQYALKISNIFRREGTRQPSVNIPSDGIFVDVPPCIPIILFISYDSVVIGFLPDLFVGHGTVDPFGNGSLVLAENDAERLPLRDGCIPKHDDCVDMIGHDDEFVNGGVREVLWNFQKHLCGDLPKSV